MIDDANHEMISAHLSAIGYTDLPSLKSLVQVAIHESSQRGYPALFLALFGDIGKALIEEFSELEIVVASATIYGHGFSAGLDWQINTAEI